jgi:hypothetical protein
MASGLTIVNWVVKLTAFLWKGLALHIPKQVTIANSKEIGTTITDNNNELNKPFKNSSSCHNST